MAVYQELDSVLRSAIANKQLLRFRYKGNERIVEPHDYGIQNGLIRLLCLQVGGRSSSPIPGWRLVDVDGIEDFEILDRHFRGSREVPSGKHHRWDEIFVRVEPSTK